MRQNVGCYALMKKHRDVFEIMSGRFFLKALNHFYVQGVFHGCIGKVFNEKVSKCHFVAFLECNVLTIR